MKRTLDLDEAATWLELAATVARLPATGLLKRLRDGDDDLSDAILAILTAERSPSDRLTAVRDFLVLHSLGETFDPATDVQQALWRPETSPFHIPQRFLDVWFPLTPDEAQQGVHIETLMRVRQFYDCVDLAEDVLASTRLFGNRNIGDQQRCNLQVPGQLTNDETPILITSWWVTTTTWPRIEDFMAKAWLTMVVGDRPEMVTPALQLWRQRQTVLIPVPSRQNFSVTFDFRRIDGLAPAYAPPLYVFVEGWGRRRQL